MTTYTAEQLYELLPAIYRAQRAPGDAEAGEPLKQLLGVIARAIGVVEGDIDQLYANWFIETCAEWVVPYLGDLLGVRGLHPLNSADFTQRAFVANTLSYRRRKGTATMLEQLARDITGWPARAVEFFELLGTTQHLNHLRLHNVRTPDLRQTYPLRLLNYPFETAGHTVEVRRIASGRGKYNIPNVGLFLWPYQVYPLTRGTPAAVPGVSDRCYTFSPLGNDLRLYNRPQREETITHLAEESDVPRSLHPLLLYNQLEAYRQALITGKDAPTLHYFDGRQPVIQIYFDPPSVDADPKQNGAPLYPEEIIICDFRNWESPRWEPPKSAVFEYHRPPEPKRLTFETKVAIDPAQGRLVVLQGIKNPPTKIEVSYTYGFSGDLGGGPYDRRLLQKPGDPAPMAYENTVAQPEPAADQGRALIRIPTDCETLDKALEVWNPTTALTVIQIEDNRTYSYTDTDTEKLTINMAGSDLVIQARNGQRPTLIGNITVQGTQPGRLMFNGLLMAGTITVKANTSLRQLDIVHCTLVPGVRLQADSTPTAPTSPSILVQPDNKTLRVNLVRSISGPLRLPADSVGLTVQDSLIDAPDRTVAAIAGDKSGLQPGPPTTLERVTVFGPVHVKELTLASDVIFTQPVTVEHRQVGCVRFSYVPEGSLTPHRYRCQPDLAISTALAAAKEQTASVLPPDQAETIRQRNQVRPSFVATWYGHPLYGRLHPACPVEITTGAEDGSEMGVFNFLQQPQREANLRASLDEYLPVGLEAGIFYQYPIQPRKWS